MKNVDEMSVFEEYIHKTHTHTTGYEWMRKYLLLMREGEKEIKKNFLSLIDLFTIRWRLIWANLLKRITWKPLKLKFNSCAFHVLLLSESRSRFMMLIMGDENNKIIFKHILLISVFSYINKRKLTKKCFIHQRFVNIKNEKSLNI